MLRDLAAYLGPYHALMATVLTSMVLTTVVELAAPWPLKLIVDNVLGYQPLFGRDIQGHARTVLLGVASVAFVLLATLKGSLAALRTRYLTEVSEKASADMRRDLYAQVQRVSLTFHDRARVGDMTTRLTSDVDKLQDAFVTGLSLLTVDILTVFGVAAIMFYVDWQFALVSLSVLPTLFFVFMQFRRRVRQASREVRASEGAMASAAQEVLTAIRVVKAFGQEGREQERFDAQARSKVEASVRVATWEGLFSLWVEVATAVGVATVLWYGGWRVLSGDLTTGAVLVFMQYLATLYTPLRRLSRLTTVVQKASASADRVYDIFRLAPEVPEAAGATVVGRAAGRVTFRDVWFSYDPAQPVLNGLSLDIAAGEVVALVGPTGAGKSTLVSLISRFYDPQQGAVLLDGADLRTIEKSSLRRQVSFVLQDLILFSGTIRGNIAYGRPDATDAQVRDAARAAHADEFIDRLPQGYDALVGERGVTLSGGQRQRIAIARALLTDAPILVLDEPTSAVDRRTERLIWSALRHLMQGRTVIIIAHRLQTLDLADRVAVLAGGSLVAVGTPDEVKTTAGEHLEEFGAPVAVATALHPAPDGHPQAVRGI